MSGDRYTFCSSKLVLILHTLCSQFGYFHIGLMNIDRYNIVLFVANIQIRIRNVSISGNPGNSWGSVLSAIPNNV
jgi:hypothetical protein